MGPRPRISVVLPSYQEEENLRLLLPRLIVTLEEVGQSFEVVVVDTQLPLDGTRIFCGTLGVRCVARRAGNLFGHAVQTGIEEANGELVIFMDADGSHAPEFVKTLLQYGETNDVVIASRYVDQGATKNTWPLVLMSRILNWSYSLVLGIDCKDISNSFRLYRTDSVKALTLKCSNFDVVEEILFKLKRQNPGLRIKEVAFTFKQRMFGRTKRNLVVFMATYIVTLIKLRFFVG